jgi:hypothetical protein
VDVQVRGGASKLTADLRGLRLGSFDLEGGTNRLEVVLPRPLGHRGLAILGGASNVAVLRPEGVAARLCVSGGATNLKLDDRRIGAAGGELDLRDGGYDGATDRYEVVVTGGANNLSMTNSEDRREEQTLIGKASEMVAYEGDVNTAMVEAPASKRSTQQAWPGTRALRGGELSIPHGEMSPSWDLPGAARRRSSTACRASTSSIGGGVRRRRVHLRDVRQEAHPPQSEKMGFIFQTYNLIRFSPP